MKFLLFVLLFVSVVCYAESDSVQAQKGTQLISFSSFKTDAGKELRVVEFRKPSIHHFFTYSNNQIFMNSVLDKQKNLREVRFTHNQFELNPYTATKDTPLAWTMTMIRAVQAKSQTALTNTALESRKSRLLIESLTRSCGNIQVFGELNDDKTAIDRYVVHVEGVGEMRTNAPVEGVSCDDRSLVVGTVKCETDKGPCLQTLSGVQYENNPQIPSDEELLIKLFGKIDNSGRVDSTPAHKEPTYVSILLTRYFEMQNRKLMYVVVEGVNDKDSYNYCNSCTSIYETYFLEFYNNNWQLSKDVIFYEFNYYPSHYYYVKEIGTSAVGLFIERSYSNQGEAGFNYEVYNIGRGSSNLVLTHSHAYMFNPSCPIRKDNKSKIDFQGDGDMYDIRIVQNHYNEVHSCEKRKYVNEEYLYKFKDGMYKLIRTDEIQHYANY